MRQIDRQGHQRLGLIAGEAEHHPLIAGAELFDFFVADVPAAGLQRGVDPLLDIRALLAQRQEHGAGVAVEAFAAVVIADAGHDAARQLVEVDLGPSGDLAEEHDEARLGGRLAGHARSGILRQAGVHHRVRNLVADLVGMALGDRLGCEQKSGRGHEAGRHPQAPDNEDCPIA